MVRVELGTELEEQLVRAAQGKGLSLNEYLRRELAAKAPVAESADEQTTARRREAVERMLSFASEYKFTLGPDLTFKDLVNEGRR